MAEKETKKEVATPVSKPKKSKKVLLTYKQSAKYDFHYNREVYTFLGRETKEFPISILKWKHWDHESKKFRVEVVNG